MPANAAATKSGRDAPGTPSPSASAPVPPVPLDVLLPAPTPTPADALADTLPVGRDVVPLGQGSDVAVEFAVGLVGVVEGVVEVGLVRVIGMMPDDVVPVVVVVVVVTDVSVAVALPVVSVGQVGCVVSVAVDVEVVVVVVGVDVPWLTPAGARKSKTTTSRAAEDSASARRVGVSFIMFGNEGTLSILKPCRANLGASTLAPRLARPNRRGCNESIKNPGPAFP